MTIATMLKKEIETLPEESIWTQLLKEKKRIGYEL